jgi:hypothetical protein
VHHDKKFHQKSAADPYYVKDIDFQAAWLELRQTPRTLVQLLYQKSCSVTLSSPTQTLVLESGDAADKPHKDEVTLIPTGIQSPNAGSSPTDVPFSSFVFNKVVLELDGVQTTILNGPFPPTSAPTVCIHYCKGGNCDINLLKVCQ